MNNPFTWKDFVEPRNLDTDLVIYRTQFALDPNSQLPITSNFILAADGQGGQVWQDIFNVLSTQSVVSSNPVGYLPETISSLRATDAGLSTLVQSNFDTLSAAIGAGISPGGATATELLSVSAYVFSTAWYISAGNLISTQNYILSQSNNFGVQLNSTVRGLGTVGYISAAQYNNDMRNLISSFSEYGYVSASQLASTVVGMSNVGYVVGTQLTSTILNMLYPNTVIGYPAGLGVVTTTATDPNFVDFNSILAQYLTTNQYYNSNDLATYGYVSGTELPSTTIGIISSLGTYGYVSASQLTSSIEYLMRPITINQAGNLTITNSIVGISSLDAIIYLSSCVQSSVVYKGNNGAITGYPESVDTFLFSTANLQLNQFSSFITSNSVVSVDVYPNLLFPRSIIPLNDRTPILPISTFVRYNASIVSPIHQANLYAPLSNSYASNAFQQPMRISMRGSNIVGNWSYPYELVHRLPGGISYLTAAGLYSGDVNAFFASTNSYFVTVQNPPP